MEADMELNVQQAREEDFEELVRVDSETWSSFPPEVIKKKVSSEVTAVKARSEVSAKKIRSQLKIFPEGYFCAFINGEMAGSFATMKKNYDINYPVTTWVEATAEGLITNHEPNGNALYGVSLGVPPQYRGLGVGKKLVERAKQLVVESNLELLVLGARIPFYYKYEDMIVTEYVNKRKENGDRFEPELRFYERCGLSVGKILPEHMTGKWADHESKNYGVQMYWMNPSY
jgi:GNAT superfamily N-acetyltransferase